MKAATDEYARIMEAALFQSTPPVKAATEWTADDTGVTKISIHAAREGGDDRPFQYVGLTKFQSTPPVKAATRTECLNAAWTMISIHAAREGGDFVAGSVSGIGSISIHAAREGGDLLRGYNKGIKRISIHAAREGGDRHKKVSFTVKPHFNPRRP